MWRITFVLGGLLCAFSIQAITNHEMLNNLTSRFHQLRGERGTLIKSFTNNSQSYIYDQALAVIAFTKSNDQKKARTLLKGLLSLQLKDGALYFSYYLDGSSPYPKEGDRRIAGAISWVALAAAHYQNKFKSDEFKTFNENILSYLDSQIVPVSNSSLKALRFAAEDLGPTVFNEKEIAALEHNLDAYAAFKQFNRLNKESKWVENEEQLKKFIFSMWDKRRNHFWSGANLKTGQINKEEFYLDNQSWGLLALDLESLKEIVPKDALAFNCESFFATHKDVNGFMDTRPARGPASEGFVWSEGTLGHVLAMKKVNMESCQDKTAADFLNSIKKMKTQDGGIAYATSDKKDFTTSSSVAGTAWLYFASNDINPFELN